MVQPPVSSRPFQGRQIPGLLYDANQRGVSAPVPTYLAQLPFRQIEALRAGMDVVLDSPQGLSQGQNLLSVGRQQVMGQAFGGFGTDAGQLAEFLRQPPDH